ncbi:Origin recognition complex subunit 3, partial [Modicella reniformis]
IWSFPYNMTPASFTNCTSNLYDWFTAFGMILERGLTNTNQGKQHDDGNDKREEEDSDEDQSTSRKRVKGKQKLKTVAMSKKQKQQQQQQKQQKQKQEGLDQKEVQARFISSVAELQFMGFIKPINRKTDHVQRLTWGYI